MRIEECVPYGILGVNVSSAGPGCEWNSMQALRKVVVNPHGSFSITSQPSFARFKRRDTTNLAEKYQTR